MKVLFEDNHLIAVDKPIGVLSQGDKTGDDSIMDEIKAYIKKKYNKPGDVFLGCVHRIDRVTSGVILFARTSKALTRLNKLIKERKAHKTYLAILDERPPEPNGKLIHYLHKNQKANFTVVYFEEKPESKKAILTYELLAELDGKYLVKVKIETGRPHQIRSQFSFIGCPITGDTKYGGSKDNQIKKGIYLHSLQLEIVHPVKKEPIRIYGKPLNKGLWKTFREFI